MAKVLNIISSIRGGESATIRLSEAIVEKVKRENKNVSIKELNLADKPLEHISIREVGAFFTPAEARTAEQLQAIKLSEEAVSAFLDADIIVIGAPTYNFTIPSTLKSYFDRLARPGVTFRYGQNGPEGLLQGKKVFIATASGSQLTAEYMQKLDFVVPYLKAFLGFMGITDITIYRAEGLNVAGLKENALQLALDEINKN